MSAEPRQPLIAVVGTTGVGKSLLGIKLAKQIQKDASNDDGAQWKSAAVLNTDSMQVYRGLDVITNKATRQEMEGVRHHLMNFLDPGQEYRVGQFQQDALAKIEEMHKNKEIPIAVGGTAYYLQHLVFPNQLVADVPVTQQPHLTSGNDSVSKRGLQDLTAFPQDLKDSILSLPIELLDLFYTLPSLPQTSTPNEFPPAFPIERLPTAFDTPRTFTSGLYTLLKHVDPDSASRWHWRDIRKVRRALEIVWEGRRWQDVRNAQLEAQADNPRAARFSTLVFWLYADNDTLFPRLDTRVDKMVELGLLDEIRQLWTIAERDGAGQTDFSKGIYQAIGYKEFQQYLVATDHGQETKDVQVQRLFTKALEDMKTSTRQYAKRQVKWIKTKLLPAARQANEDVHVFLLDATEFLKHDQLPEPALLSPVAAAHLSTATSHSETAAIKVVCDVCTTDASKPFMVEERQLAAHRKTRAHQRSAKAKIGNPMRGECKEQV
ncbi:tRNA dimethylallyltransferase, mitochondrial [Microbotryomycetes sp. JL221]|nr:tRNA dimethylallyltransferase, mitochondrial [Microbotryomycetes sp. JL221]